MKTCNNILMALVLVLVLLFGIVRLLALYIISLSSVISASAANSRIDCYTTPPHHNYHTQTQFLHYTYIVQFPFYRELLDSSNYIISFNFINFPSFTQEEDLEQ